MKTVRVLETIAARLPGRGTRLARALRLVAALLLLAAAATAILLWPALAADVGRLETQWPDTLLPERRPRVWTRLDAIDPKLRWAVIAAEDSKFYVHGGIDWEATFDAFRTNIGKGRYVRGGSTITQQLAKNLFLTREKSLVRKAREAVLAWRLDTTLSKRRILELYLNVAEWGQGVYGAEGAARRHLGHSASRLTWGEAATLAAILPSPVNKLDPDRSPGRVRRRRAVVLSHLYHAGRISREEMVVARAAPLTAAEARAAAEAEAREEAEERAQPSGRSSSFVPAVLPPGSAARNVPPAEPPALAEPALRPAEPWPAPPGPSGALPPASSLPPAGPSEPPAAQDDEPTVPGTPAAPAAELAAPAAEPAAEPTP